MNPAPNGNGKDIPPAADIPPKPAAPSIAAANGTKPPVRSVPSRAPQAPQVTPEGGETLDSLADELLSYLDDVQSSTEEMREQIQTLRDEQQTHHQRLLDLEIGAKAGARGTPPGNKPGAAANGEAPPAQQKKRHWYWGEVKE